MQILQKQTVIHLLLECKVSKILWTEICKMLGPKLTSECEWDNWSIISNKVHSNAKHIVNILVLSTKYFIFQQKCLGNTPTITGLKREFEFLYKYEKDNAFQNMKSKAFYRKWLPVLQSFQHLET